MEINKCKAGGSGSEKIGRGDRSIDVNIDCHHCGHIDRRRRKEYGSSKRPILNTKNIQHLQYLMHILTFATDHS